MLLLLKLLRIGVRHGNRHRHQRFAFSGVRHRQSTTRCGIPKCLSLLGRHSLGGSSHCTTTHGIRVSMARRLNFGRRYRRTRGRTLTRVYSDRRGMNSVATTKRRCISSVGGWRGSMPMPRGSIAILGMRVCSIWVVGIESCCRGRSWNEGALVHTRASRMLLLRHLKWLVGVWCDCRSTCCRLVFIVEIEALISVMGSYDMCRIKVAIE